MEDDSKRRIEGFMESYHKLTNDWGVDFANYPVYIPDGQGGFKTVIQCTPVDLKNRAQPSPFMGDEAKDS